MGRVEREILAPVAYMIFFFKKPSLYAFSDSFGSRGSYCWPAYPPHGDEGMPTGMRAHPPPAAAAATPAGAFKYPAYRVARGFSPSL
jgi:hypothetical protein